MKYLKFVIFYMVTCFISVVSFNTYATENTLYNDTIKILETNKPNKNKVPHKLIVLMNAKRSYRVSGILDTTFENKIACKKVLYNLENNLNIDIATSGCYPIK